MSITIHIFYRGEKGAARAFAREMMESGVVGRIRAKEGNLRYEYFLPAEDPETVLLIDAWADQHALDLHHASPVMDEIIRLREKYDLHMRVERYIPDAGGIPDADRSFIRAVGHDPKEETL